MDKELRKLRKKLREVERLQTHASLTEEEKIKLQKREEFQQRIAQILENPNLIAKEEEEEEPQKYDEEEFEFFVEQTKRVEEPSTGGRMKRKSTSDESEVGKVARLDGAVSDKSELESERLNSDGSNEQSLTNGFHIDNGQNNSTSMNYPDTTTCQPKMQLTSNGGDDVPEKPSKPQSSVPRQGSASKSSPSTSKVSPSTSKQPNVAPEKEQNHRSPAVKASSLEAQTKAKNVEWAKKLRFYGGHCEGHNDMLFSVDSDGTLAVSGSRDTMLKVWDCSSGRELFSLLGHSGTVTCVQMIDAQEGLTRNILKEIYENNNLDPACINVNDKFCVSGSHDCSLNLWNISRGCLVQSIYTFNAISCLLFDSQTQTAAKKDQKSAFVFTGNDAGKIQIWNLTSKQEIFSVVAHEGAVMAIKKCANRMYSCGLDGLVKVWQKTAAAITAFGDKSYQFGPTFASECIKVVPSGVSATNSGDVALREHDYGYCLGRIRTMDVDFEEELIYIGDDGPNVKILDWQNGLLYKLRNHRLAFGYTDAVQLSGNYLLASSFYLDNGKGSINIFHRPKKSQLKDPFRSFYISTLVESKDTTRVGRIFCFKFTTDNTLDLCSLVMGSDTLFNFSSANKTPNRGGKDKSPGSITLQSKSFKWRVRVDDSDDGGVESQDNEELNGGGSTDEDGETDQSNNDVSNKMGNMQLVTRSFFRLDWCNIL